MTAKSEVSTTRKISKSLGVTEQKSIAEYSASAMKIYGTEVVEQRAIPDFRDGLKPVQRCLLWAAYKLGVHSGGAFKKSARLVGEVIGKYHPHGDLSCYQALVGLAGTKFQGESKGWATRNCSVPLYEGQGNWGDFIDPAAAYRYTNGRLSKFSDKMMLDPNYLAVMEYLPNYDESEKIPLVLPAKLPVILLNGFTSIAVGVAGGSPPFHVKGVLELTKKALSGNAISIRDCIKHLEFDYPYGGVCISEPKDLIPMYKGKGNSYFMPSYELDNEKRTLTFVNVCPGLMSGGSIEKFLENLSQVAGVVSVDDDTNKYGARYVVEFSRKLGEKDLDEAVDKCLELSVRSDSYDVGITIRNSNGADFKKVTIPQIFELWADWRIDLETKVIKRLVSIQEEQLARQELIFLAVDNLDIIVKALKVEAQEVKINVDGKQMVVDGAVAYLVKNLRISVDQANYILDIKVRQLRALERTKILAKIAEIKKTLKSLSSDLKNPGDRVLRDLDTIQISEF